MSDQLQRRLLLTVFLINFLLFILEMLAGVVSRSLGLVADSLDMFADAVVYGLSYFAVGRVIARKKRIARWSGYLQLTLALIGMAEVIRRFLGMEETPVFTVMITISVIALLGNIASMYFLKRTKSTEVHIQASVIFTNNDILANIGVIVAGIMVYLMDSRYPDLVIGAMIFLLVSRGALRILRLSKADKNPA